MFLTLKVSGHKNVTDEALKRLLEGLFVWAFFACGIINRKTDTLNLRN